MPNLNDAAYYRSRAAQARTLAEAAADPAIANIHRRMAKNYDDWAELSTPTQTDCTLSRRKIDSKL